MEILPSASITSVTNAGGSVPSTGSSKDQFMQLLSQVDNNIHDAGSSLEKFSLGEADSLHQVMLSISKAKTSFEFVVQVRNRLVEGYQEVLRMGV